MLALKRQPGRGTRAEAGAGAGNSSWNWEPSACSLLGPVNLWHRIPAWHAIWPRQLNVVAISHFSDFPRDALPPPPPPPALLQN